MTAGQRELIDIARSELSAALVQVHPSDDKIIVAHMESAEKILAAVLRGDAA